MDDGNFKLYQAQDGVIYLDEVRTLCARDDGAWRSLLIVIPLRLGLDQINTIYVDLVKESFRYSQSVGIVGGKPHSAYYFVGTQDDHLYYLDPHVVQPAIPTADPSFDSESYHCSTLKKIAISGLDPSLAFGFYCRDETDFRQFVERLQQLPNTVGDGGLMLSVVAKRPDYDDSRDIFREHEQDPLQAIGDAEFVQDLVII